MTISRTILMERKSVDRGSPKWFEIGLSDELPDGKVCESVANSRSTSKAEGNAAGISLPASKDRGPIRIGVPL